MSDLGKPVHWLLTGQFGKFCAAVSERVPLWLFHRTKAFLFEALPDAASGTELLPDGYLCRPAVRNDLTALSAMTGLPFYEYRRRFEQGDLCYAVFRSDRPVNLNWVHRGACYVRGAGFRLDEPPSRAYIYGIFTDPAERGRKLYQICLRHLAAYLADRSAAHLVQMVEADNAPVLHTLPRLGYIRTTTINHVRLLGIKYTMVHDERSGRVTRRLFVREPRDVFVI